MNTIHMKVNKRDNNKESSCKYTILLNVLLQRQGGGEGTGEVKLKRASYTFSEWLETV